MTFIYKKLFDYRIVASLLGFLAFVLTLVSVVSFRTILDHNTFAILRISPFTGIGFLFLSASYFSLFMAQDDYRYRGFFKTAACLHLSGVLGLGFTVLYLRFLPTNMQHIFHYWNIPADTKVPAAITGLIFILTAIQCIFDLFRKTSLNRTISISVIFVCSVILISYMYGAEMFYELMLFKEVSIPTLFIFLLFHIALIWSNEEYIRFLEKMIFSFKKVISTQEKSMVAALILVFLSFLVASVISSRSLNSLTNTILKVTETQQTLDRLNDLQIGLIGAETGQRGYILTSEHKYLEDYVLGIQQYNENINLLNEWKKNPIQQKLFDDLKRDTGIKLQELALTIRLMNEKKSEQAVEIVRSNVGRSTMSRIKEDLLLLREEQIINRDQYRAIRLQQKNKTIAALVIGTFLAIATLILTYISYVRNSLKRYESDNLAKELNNALEKKIREIEAVNAELDSFSYSVSHDLRAPLRSMAGFSSIVIEDYGPSLPPEAQNYLDKIRASAQKMGLLIDGILNLSKLSKRKIILEEFDLVPVANRIIEELRLQDSHRTVEFKHPPVMLVKADKFLMEVVLQNLLANAWKFSSKKSVAQIEIGVFAKGPRQVYFVKDNGVGFDEIYSSKLFGAFQRLHTDKEFPGTGIGLATVRRIINLHMGSIWAESKVGLGSAFYFTIG